MPERVTEETMARLRELRAKALQGKWGADADYLIGPVPNGRPGGENIAMFVSHPRHEKVPSEETCAYVAELHNAAPDLLDTIDHQQSVIAALVDMLREIVSVEPIDHDPEHKRISYVELQVEREDLAKCKELLTDLSSFAAAHDRRIRAEGAAEALTKIADRWRLAARDECNPRLIIGDVEAEAAARRGEVGT